MDSDLSARWLDPKGLLVVGALLSVLSGAGLVGDMQGAALLALWVTLVVANYVNVEAHPLERPALRAGVVGAAALLVVVPFVATLLPGDPIVDADLREGQHLAIPSDVEGRVRVMVHADIAGEGAATVSYRMSGLEQPVSGKLERSIGKGRVGKRRVSQAHLHDTELVSAVVGNQHELTLEQAQGALQGPLHVALFRERWPASYQLMLGGILLLIVVFASLRGRVGDKLFPVVVGVTCFGVLTYRWTTPYAAFSSEMGALIVSVACAAVMSVPWGWFVARRVQAA